MTQASILLKIAVLTIVFAEKLDGFILNNLLPETTTEEEPISPTTTFSRDAVTSQYVFDEIHTNFSEVSEKFLNKTTAHPKTDTVNINLKVHAKSNQAHLLTNESNSVDLKSPLKTLEYANDKENEIVAKNLDNPIENNIGNDVHKGSLPVESEQIYQNKAEITENRDITQPEVPQILNEDELSETTTQTATDDRNTSLETTTAALIENKGNENSLYLTTIPSVEMEPVPNKESTSFVETMTAEQTTLMPSHQENLQDLNRFFETEPSRARQMRDFNFDANANEKTVDSNVSSEIDLISGKTNDSSSDSLDSSSSSSSMQDENNAGEETSNTEEVSAENLFETKLNHTSEEAVIMEDLISNNSSSLRPITVKPIEIGTEVIPQEQIKSKTETVVPIEEIQAITESVGYGDVVNDTIKPDVEKKLSVSNATITEHIPHNEILGEEHGYTIDSVENGFKGRWTNTIQSVTGATQVIFTETPPLEPSKPTENAPHTILPKKENSYHSSAIFHVTESDILPEIDIPTQTSVEVTHKSEIKYNDNEIDDDNDSVRIKAESALHEDIQIATEDHQNYSSNSQDTNASDLNSKPHSPELPEISSVQTTSSRALLYLENELETSTETTIVKSNKISPTEELQNDQKGQESFTNEISEETGVPIKNRKGQVENSVLETSSGNDVPINPTHDINTYIGAEPTTEYTRHIDTLQTMRDESSVISDEVISPTPVARSLNAIVAEGLGKPLPTRSVGDEPSSSSYLSEDKTTTVLVLCSAAGGIFFAFSVAIYLISFQRQHGTLDIEMQEQECGKDDLDNDEDSETRVSLLNKQPTADSDDHSSD